MQVEIGFQNDFIEIVFTLVAWGLIAFMAVRYYNNQRETTTLWKACLVTFIGIFSFTFNFTILDTLVKVAILPLGVWVLYWLLKEKGDIWKRYRKFAWLGFWANYLFLMTTLLSIPIHHIVYPKDDAKTYVANVENATIVPTHPSAGEVSLNHEKLAEQLWTMNIEAIYSDTWYMDLYYEQDTLEIEERFPYQLAGTSSKWGSGLATVIFVENDGKGLLISTSKNQVYFRSNEIFLEGELKK
jgi:hypothetical protein